MNFSLKPNTIISHFLPGSFFLGALVVLLMVRNPLWAGQVVGLPGSLVAVFSGVGFILALLIGLIFDAMRHWTEPLWDRFDQVDKDGKWWNFFFTGDKDKLEQLIENYYSYYVFDANFVIAMGVLTLVGIYLLWNNSLMFWLIALFFVIMVLFIDARNLRKEIKRLVLDEIAKEKKGGEETAT